MIEADKHGPAAMRGEREALESVQDAEEAGLADMVLSAPTGEGFSSAAEAGLPGSTMSAVLRQGERVGLFRYLLSSEQWKTLLTTPGHSLPLLASWADEKTATVMLLEGEIPVLASTAVQQRRYLAPSGRYEAAMLGERMACDLWGVEAQYSRDDAPVLDDGCWTVTWPLDAEPVPAGGRAAPVGPDGLPPNQTGLAGVVGLARGERHQLEVRLFEAHRGLQARLRGLTPLEALPLVSRASAVGFVAHPLAFARAVEQACGLMPDPNERDVRLLLLELERLSVHLYDLTRSAREVGADMLALQCALVRERLAEVCAANGIGRRLTDTVGLLPLGCAVPEPMPLAQAVVATLTPFLPRLEGLNRIYASRLAGLGVLAPDVAWRYGVGGAAGRASGRHVDMRRTEVGMRVETLRTSGHHEGDALARNKVRLGEIRDSLALISRVIASVGQGDEAQPFPVTGEGLGGAEGARGDVWYWVRLDVQGRLTDVQIRDPAVALLGALGNVLGARPLSEAASVLASLGVSPAGAAL